MPYADPEAKRAHNRAYYAANCDTLKSRMRTYRDTNHDTLKAYREANRETRRASTQAWRKANRNHLKAYREANLESARDRTRRWQKTNREAGREACRRRRARKRAATVVPFTAAQLAARLSVWPGCWMCGGPKEHVDHVKPLTKGGPHMLANLRPACARCNTSKGDRWPLVTAC